MLLTPYAHLNFLDPPSEDTYRTLCHICCVYRIVQWYIPAVKKYSAVFTLLGWPRFSRLCRIHMTWIGVEICYYNTRRVYSWWSACSLTISAHRNEKRKIGERHIGEYWSTRLEGLRSIQIFINVLIPRDIILRVYKSVAVQNESNTALYHARPMRPITYLITSL